jgi:hypothetical protein
MTRCKAIATTGDASPFDYGGGIVYDHGTHVAWVVWPMLDESENPTPVYIVDVPADVFAWHDWADSSAIARTCGTEPADLRADGYDADPCIRVRALECIAAHYGYGELDTQARSMRIAEIKRRYGRAWEAARKRENMDGAL